MTYNSVKNSKLILANASLPLPVVMRSFSPCNPIFLHTCSYRIAASTSVNFGLWISFSNKIILFSEFLRIFQIIRVIILIFSLELNPFNGKLKNFFYEIEVFYLDFLCPKLSLGFFFAWNFFSIYFHGLKDLSRLF